MTIGALPDSRDAVGIRLRRLAAALLLLLILVGAAGVVAIQVATNQVDRLTRGYTPASDAHTQTLTLMLNAESAVRGYLLTGIDSFLKPYQDSRPQILPSLDRTESALHGIGVRTWDSAISAERRDIIQWLSQYADPIAANPTANLPDQPAQQAGKLLFDRFRAADAVVSARIEASRASLRSQTREIRSLAVPLLIVATVVSVLVAAILALRTATGISRPLRALRSVVSRLDRGDLAAHANEQDGPSEVRALARAVNAMGRRARAEATADRDAEQFRQRTRLISSTIRRTTNGAQMADHLVRGLGDAFEVDRVWLQTFADDRVPQLTAQWHKENLGPLPPAAEHQLAEAQALADRLWDSAQVITINDYRTYVPSPSGRAIFKLARTAGASASMVVPIGDNTSAFGIMWIAMTGHSRHWTLTETGVAQFLAADLAHSLVQAHVIARQAEAVQALRELDQAKSDFVSTVSHELRTPLTSISGYLEMLQDGDGGDLPESTRQMLAVIDRNATRLRNLIEDLLTQSRIDAGRLRLELTTVEISSVLRTVHEAMLPLAAANHVRLTLEAPGDLKVEGDPVQLEQVFTNLIANACKFTPPGGRVRVELAADEDDGVLVLVSDNGIGIPVQDIGNLFTRFFRASNATAAALPGTGLGLAIVREIVQRHGGSIDVESELGAGSTFSVWLPGRVASG
ncbi:MAG TPA: ATP-binding protein [Jatrophihabitans sp.]|nr:ATP-binding protein [Jatrophihabitans sp.]